jgi:hypothetical protein
MRTELHRIIHLKNFFKVVSSSSNYVTYNYKKPSKVLLHNININWLMAICAKSTKHFPVFVNKDIEDLKDKVPPFGVIRPHTPDQNDSCVKHSLSEYAPENKTNLHLDLFVPKQDAMQYFIQWQRLRKYWWSSVSVLVTFFFRVSLAYYVILMM